MDKTVFTFGRLNPPTIGHEKLVDKVKQLAKTQKAEPHVYLSHSQNAKKDPLSYQQKYKYAKQSFGNIVYRSNSKTIIQIMQELEKMGHKEVTMVVGSDRVQEFRNLLIKYNGKDYTFDKVRVVSAGERDPDAEGVSGMSASKMRALASEGNFQQFKKGAPSKMSQANVARLYQDLRSAMNVTEDLDDFDWDEWADTVDIEAATIEILDEVLTLQQRMKRARAMKMRAPRMKNQRRIKKFKMADKAKLMKRARKQAIQMFRKKVAGDKGENYAKLSPAAKMSVDRLVSKKLPAVGRLALRLIPNVRKKEVERLRSLRKSTANEQLEEGNKAQLGIPANATNAQLKKIRSSDSSTKAQKQRAHWLLNMRKEEVAQDQDIKDRKGTQPKKYFKDLDKDTKAARDAHFKKHADKDDKDPANYEPAPGDKDAKTKVSVHTKKYKKMFGEDYNTPAAVDKADEKYTRFDAINDLALNTKNRNLTIDAYSYGPANPGNEKESEAFWNDKADLWNTSVDQVKSMRCNNCSAFNQTPQVIKMIGDALGPKGDDIVEKADIGYCEFFGFKCAGARSCDAWVGGGALKESNEHTLDEKFEALIEQEVAARVTGPSTTRTQQRHSTEKDRLRDKHSREKERLKSRHDAQKNRSQIRDIRSEDLDEAFEQLVYLKEIDALKKKAEKSGISYGTLKKVYDRGMAAWKSGHRPGTTPQQWAFARVNSFVTKGKGTWGGADKDLASKVRKESIEWKIDKDGDYPENYPHNLNKTFQSVVEDSPSDREFGTDKLVKKYKQDTPMEENDEYTPHWMYKDDDKVWAKTKADHDKLNKQGYDHDDPKTKKVEK